jgi:hypothetical protein
MKGVEILLSHINSIATFKTRMNNMYYTYAYMRKDKTPYYIGKGKDDRAFVKNRRGVKPPKDKSKIIFLKQNLTEEEAFKHEKYMIAVFGRKDMRTGILHNRTDGGDGTSGYVHTDENRKKISENTKYAMKNEDIRKKISQVNKGRKHSEESKRKIGQASKGRKHSEESKRKMSKSQKGIFHSEETKIKISKSHEGKKRSVEHRKKISEAKYGEKHPNYNKKWWNNGFENKMSIECPGDEWGIGRVGYKRVLKSKETK